MKFVFSFIALVMLSAAAVHAADESRDIVVNVHGIVCSFCAQGVTKKVAKLPFVDRSRYKKGVKVEIENQLVTVAIKPGVEPDMAALFDAIRSGGYDPVEAFEILPSGERVKIEAGG